MLLPVRFKIKTENKLNSAKIQLELFKKGFSWHLDGKVTKHTEMYALYADTVRMLLHYSDKSHFKRAGIPEVSLDQIKTSKRAVRLEIDDKVICIGSDCTYIDYEMISNENIVLFSKIISKNKIL